ncbi:MAG: hypothetical protein ABFS14_11045 [Gemmatimonadota bacterium]
MDWDLIAPMVVALTLIVTAAGVYLLRPIMSRLGHLLEVMSKERLGELPSRSEDRQLELLESLNARMSLVEERLDFTDRLLSTTEAKVKLPVTADEAAADG